ncbi:MAG: acyltransferase [Treponema sp.]|jgi:acetyltransferase-like isoleucine patch superfamily enzyme|nr:acyltransferase [Treponema sp.]
MNILRKIQKGFLLLIKLDFIECIKLNLFKKYEGWFLPFRGGYYDIHKTAIIIINKNASFSFNRKKGKDPFQGHFVMEEGAKLIVNGHFSIESGGRVLICKNAALELDSGYIGNNVFIVCKKNIKIGNGATISHNLVLRDNDAHEIIDENYISIKSIEIGDHVWIGTNVTILKGVKIGNGAVIGANSLVNKSIPEKTIAAGNPAKIKKENIRWK